MSKRITLPIYLRAFLILLLLPVFALAEKPITGQVLSSTDQTPIAGATVVIKGSKSWYLNRPGRKIYHHCERRRCAGDNRNRNYATGSYCWLRR